MQSPLFRLSATVSRRQLYVNHISAFAVYSFYRAQLRQSATQLRVCPSVCLSHAGTESKLITVGSCGIQHRVAQGLYIILYQLSYPTSRWNSLSECIKRDWSKQNSKKLERHSVERIYLAQRSCDGSVNKTILKPRLAVAARRQWDFPDV